MDNDLLTYPPRPLWFFNKQLHWMVLGTYPSHHAAIVPLAGIFLSVESTEYMTLQYILYMRSEWNQNAYNIQIS